MNRSSTPILCSTLTGLTCVCLFLTGFAACKAENGAAMAELEGLELKIDIANPTIRQGDQVEIVARILNRHDQNIVIDTGGICRYVSFETIPGADDEIGTVGQIVGDAATASAGSLLILEVGRQFESSCDISAIFRDSRQAPQMYNVYVEYCPSGGSEPSDTRTPIPCLRSNTLQLTVVH